MMRGSGTVRRFASDQTGSMVTYVAFIAPVLVGVAALGVEIVTWHAESRGVQLAADGAALAGVYAGVRDGRTTTTIEAAVEAQVAANGYDASEVSVFWPPQHSTVPGVNGDTRAVEIILERQVPSLLASVIGVGDASVSARAVAVFDTPDCVLTLNDSDSGAITVSGSSTVTFPCSMHSNSASPSAIKQSGTTSFLISSGGSIGAVGGATGNNIFPIPDEGVDPEPDPFVDLPIPSYTCSGGGSTVITNFHTFTPADSPFCGSLSLNAGSTEPIIFEPGLYIFDSGLSIAGSASVSGDGVTFYFGPTTSNNISVSGSATVDLTAPVDGPYAGIVFFFDPNMPAQNQNFTGGSNLMIDGIIYAPTQDIKFSGGSFGGETPTMIVSDTLEFTGTTFMGDLTESAVGQGGTLVEATIIE